LERILALLEGRERGLSRELLDGLNWHPYPSGEGEWIFADSAPPDLVNALEKAGGVCVLYGYRYRFRGPKDSPKKFIARRKIG